MNELTFGNCAALLRQNGFAPIPLGNSGKPLGPVYVTQVDFARNPSNADLPVAVLTSAPMPQGPHAPIQNAAETWLVTIAVSVSDAVKADVDAIVKRYVGAAKCPVRVSDGEALYVFKLAGDRFSTLATAYGHQPDVVRVESAASFVPLNGQWTDGISLLDVFRSELPPLSRDHAQALVDAVDRLLSDRAPEVDCFPPPAAPRPMLQPGEPLRWRHERALNALRENGFRNLLPLRPADFSVERDGFADSNGRWVWNEHVDLSGHHVGLSLKGFALVECTTRQRADIDALVQSFGPALVRTAEGKQAWLFRSQGGADQALSGAAGCVNVLRSGVVALSTGKWAPDLLTTKSSELPEFDVHHGQRLERLLQSLPPTDYDKAPAKRRKTA